MTDLDDDYEYGDPDDDWYDDDDRYEPDEADWEEAKAQAEYAAHCEQAHGGEHCDCRPPLPARLRHRLDDALRHARRLLHRPPRYSDEPPF